LNVIPAHLRHAKAYGHYSDTDVSRAPPLSFGATGQPLFFTVRPSDCLAGLDLTFPAVILRFLNARLPLFHPEVSGSGWRLRIRWKGYSAQRLNTQG
jgi:hypothetical protein